MTINEHLREFAGRSVQDFDGHGIKDPKSEAYRISLSYEEYNDDGLYWEDKLDRFLEHAKSSSAEAIVIGAWEDVGSQDSEFIVELLVDRKDRLPNLKALFFGDIIMEESECSWIEHGDMSPLLQAFPRLSHFAVRGGGGLSLGAVDHSNLRALIVQSGGLPQRVVNEVASARLPKLEHLELWLGEDNYGGDCTAEDLEPFVSKNLFPNLIFLGLKNSEIQDDIAILVANSPVLEKIKVLDLSMGTLTDKGAEALLANPKLRQLEYLDLHHHYLSTELVKRILALGIPVNISDRQSEEVSDGEVWRFIAVSE